MIRLLFLRTKRLPENSPSELVQLSNTGIVKTKFVDFLSAPLAPQDDLDSHRSARGRSDDLCQSVETVVDF